jgi:hypothetical protein
LKRELASEDTSELERLAPHALPKPSVTHSKISGLDTIDSESKLCESKYNNVMQFFAPIVSESKVVVAKEVSMIKVELIANTRKEESFLECFKTNIADKLIDFRFGMQECKIDAQKIAKKLSAVDAALKSISLQINEMEVNMSLISV